MFTYPTKTQPHRLSIVQDTEMTCFLEKSHLASIHTVRFKYHLFTKSTLNYSRNSNIQCRTRCVVKNCIFMSKHSLYDIF